MKKIEKYVHDDLEGVTKEMWEAAEAAIKLTDKQRKELLKNILFYGTSHPFQNPPDTNPLTNDTK